MGGECRGGRFAVGAGDDHDLGARPLPRPFAEEELGVADDFDARFLRLPHAPMGLGMGQRNAGSEHERSDPGPIGAGEVAQRHALGRGPVARLLRVIPGEHPRAAGGKGVGSGDAAQAQSKHRDIAAGKDRHGNHSLESTAI